MEAVLFASIENDLEQARGQTGSVRASTVGFPNNSDFAVTAASAGGKLLWSHQLPKGLYISLGTHQGSIVIFALNYMPAAATRPRAPVLLLDPKTGDLTEAGLNDGAAMFHYAGQSTFFRIASGSGQVWTLSDNGLVQQASGITSATIEKKFSLKAFVGPGNMAVVDAVGSSVALVSLTSGAVRDSALASDVVSDVRAESDALFARVGNRNLRYATRVFISAIGGDDTGAVYATVVGRTGGVNPVIRIDENGMASTLGNILLPVNENGSHMMPAGLVVWQRELAVIGAAGQIAWYQLPLA